MVLSCPGAYGDGLYFYTFKKNSPRGENLRTKGRSWLRLQQYLCFLQLFRVMESTSNIRFSSFVWYEHFVKLAPAKSVPLKKRGKVGKNA